MKSRRREKAHVVMQRAVLHIVVQPCYNGRCSTRAVLRWHGQEERRPTRQLYRFGLQPLELATGRESAQARIAGQLIERAHELSVRLALLEQPGQASARRFGFGFWRRLSMHISFSNNTLTRYCSRTKSEAIAAPIWL